MKVDSIHHRAIYFYSVTYSTIFGILFYIRNIALSICQGVVLSRRRSGTPEAGDEDPGGGDRADVTAEERGEDAGETEGDQN